jgi:hypothetical protein
MSDTPRPWYTPATPVSDPDGSPTTSEVVVEDIALEVAVPEVGAPEVVAEVVAAEMAVPEVVTAEVKAEVAAAEVVVAAVSAEAGGATSTDDFDRERVLRLLDQLEADVTAVEAAMVHAESGDSEAFAAAVASLEPQIPAG